jgi:hypothetical protein
LSYSEVKDTVDVITTRLNKYGINNYHVHHSCKSSSMYIKIGKKITIRVADHYSTSDHLCKYNIGDHICNFKKARNSYYYRSDRINNLLKKVIKDVKDNNKARR